MTCGSQRKALRRWDREDDQVPATELDSAFGPHDELSPAMQTALQRAQRASQADCPVLLYGEPGVGRRWLARFIHRRGLRHRGPLVVFEPNQSTTEAVWEALFGREDEAAASGPPGAVHAANHGTVVIHGVARLPEPVQGQLLHLLEHGSALPLRGYTDRKTSVRILATTAHTLQHPVHGRSVSPALYYHLSALTIHLPPLRNRLGELPGLVARLLEEACARRGMSTPRVDPAVHDALMRHSWPGNVGELKACVEQMVDHVESGGTLLDAARESVRRTAMRQNPASDGDSSHESTRATNLADIERRAVLEAMRLNDNNRTKAAASLGISVRTLQRKLKRWNYND
jgi:DNA-binding NtrC family response regulator